MIKKTSFGIEINGAELKLIFPSEDQIEGLMMQAQYVGTKLLLYFDLKNLNIKDVLIELNKDSVGAMMHRKD